MKLEGAHYRAIALTYQGVSQKEIAEILGVSPHTIYGWRTEPEYKRALEAFRGDAIKTARQEVTELVLISLRVVRETLTTPGPERFKAAELMVKLALSNQIPLEPEPERDDEKEDSIDKINRLLETARSYLLPSDSSEPSDDAPIEVQAFETVAEDTG